MLHLNVIVHSVHIRVSLLEFDIPLIQEVDIKEPREEQVQTTEKQKQTNKKKPKLSKMLKKRKPRFMTGLNPLYLDRPSEGRMMTMKTRSKKHLCIVT